MKRLASIVLVIASALMAVAVRGVAPAHAARAEVNGPTVNVSPLVGTQNTTYTVSGISFQPFDQITIHFTDPIGNDFPFGASLLGVTSDQNGDFQAQVRPFDIISGGFSGQWIVQACDSSGTCDGPPVNITIVGNSGAGSSPGQGQGTSVSGPIFITPAPVIVVPAPAQAPARPAPAPTQAPAPRAVPPPARLPSVPAQSTDSALPGGGSISINPGTGRQTDTFTILGINLRPFDQFTMSLADPAGNTIDYTADDGTPILTADSSGNFIVTIHPIVDLAGGPIIGTWGVAACQISSGICVSTTFTITP